METSRNKPNTKQQVYSVINTYSKSLLNSLNNRKVSSFATAQLSLLLLYVQPVRTFNPLINSSPRPRDTLPSRSNFISKLVCRATIGVICFIYRIPEHIISIYGIFFRLFIITYRRIIFN